MPFQRELRDLSFVPRWGILKTINTQSVAEHSYYVAMYADQLADVIEWGGPRDKLMKYCLWHDVEEVITGDIPGPAKRAMMRQVEGPKWVKERMEERFGDENHINPDTEAEFDQIRKIVKVADLIDEVLFLVTETVMGNRSVAENLTYSRDRLFSAFHDLDWIDSHVEQHRLFSIINDAVDKSHRFTSKVVE